MLKIKKLVIFKLIIILIKLSTVNFLNANENDIYKQLNLFGEVYERVRSEYVEKVTDKELIEAAINGMLQSLDTHSSYLNVENFDELKV